MQFWEWAVCDVTEGTDASPKPDHLVSVVSRVSSPWHGRPNRAPALAVEQKPKALNAGIIEL